MPKISFAKEYKNKAGVLFKPLFVRYLELEYWRDLEKIMADNKLDVSGAIKFAIKRASGK
jgi:hypothetical protein